MTSLTNFVFLILLAIGMSIFPARALRAQAIPCSGLAVSGDYSYEVYSLNQTLHFKFHPLAPIAGSASAIIYVKAGNFSDPFPGFPMVGANGDFTFSTSFNDGVVVRFYFSYQVPTGGERNSSNNPHDFLTGSICVAGAPSVLITAPGDAFGYTAPASIGIDATASDVNGTVNLVRFYSGTTLLGTDNTKPYHFDWVNVPEGNYSIVAKATDDSGLTTASIPVQVIVTAPNLNGFCGTAVSGDYEYKAVTVDSTVTFTFHPLAPIAGCNQALIYVRETSTGQYPGYFMTASGSSFVFSKQISIGKTVSLYFTYNVPSGGERNSSANPHAYTVGSSCGAVSTAETGLIANTFNVFPNPAGDRIFIQMTESSSGIDYLKITDALGRTKLMLQPPQLAGGVDISNFSPGTYFVQLTDQKTKRITTKKFIKR